MKDNKRLTISALITLVVLIFAILFLTSCKKEDSAQGGKIEITLSDPTRTAKVQVIQGSTQVEIWIAPNTKLTTREIPEGNYIVIGTVYDISGKLSNVMQYTSVFKGKTAKVKL